MLTLFANAIAVMPAVDGAKCDHAAGLDSIVHRV
jgi:hypothetical protein